MHTHQIIEMKKLEKKIHVSTWSFPEPNDENIPNFHLWMDDGCDNVDGLLKYYVK